MSDLARRIVIAVPAVAYALAFILAADAPTASLVIYGTVPILYFIVITLARTTAPSGAAEQDLT